MQLQKSSQKIYKHTLDCLCKIARAEGISGLQKGLTPAILREGSKNLFRIGMFEPLITFIHNKDIDGRHIPLWKRMVAGAISGAMGALACNPFELVKTRMQSTGATSAAVIHQHNYKGTFNALYSIAKSEGIAGLYAGSKLSILRSTIGNSVNMAGYSALRDYFLSNNIMEDNSVTDALCSVISSFFCALVMNPVDVARTQYYNQPHASSAYKGGLDVIMQLIAQDGYRALLKGFLPSFARLAPQFTLTFVFFEQMKRVALRYRITHRPQRIAELKGLFEEWDQSHTGKISRVELEEIADVICPHRPNDMFVTCEQHEYIISDEIQNITHKYKVGERVDFDAFVKVATDLELNVQHRELSTAFKFFDTKGDGVIDRDELYDGLATLEFPKKARNQAAHLKESKLERLTQRLMEVGDPAQKKHITFNRFSAVLDDIRAYQIRKEQKLNLGDPPV